VARGEAGAAWRRLSFQFDVDGTSWKKSGSTLLRVADDPLGGARYAISAVQAFFVEVRPEIDSLRNITSFVSRYSLAREELSAFQQY
jgi:hypothetical protein